MTQLTRRLPVLVPVLALLLVVACDLPDPEGDPDVATDTVATTTTGTDRTVTAATHRQQVQGSLRDTRERVDDREARISERSQDLWDRISTRADETWSEIESGLSGIGDDDPESIHRSREDAARRLAELDAELAEAEVSTAQTTEEFSDVSSEWIEEIESDVSQLEQLLPAAETADVDLDRDDLRNVRDRIQEIRADIQEALAEGEGLDRRDDIAGDLADLVQDVREARYHLQWSHAGEAGR